MFKIGDITIKNRLIAGPMAGINTLVYREIAVEHGAGLVYAEMVSDKAICYNNQKTLEMLDISPKEHPVAMQLFGGDIDTMVKAAIYLDNNCACDIIDINMGCPVPKVLKAGAGSKLLADPSKAYEIVKAIVENVKKPVTVKLRLGLDEKHINVVEMAKLMEKAGAKAIAIHARTKSQLYGGRADWSYIKQVKEAVSIPVIGNGDVNNIFDVKKMLTDTGCDAVMIARGAIGNPWLFENAVAYIEEGTIKDEPSKEERCKLCYEHAKRLADYYQNEDLALRQMRTLVGYYLKGFAGASRARGKLNSIATLSDLEAVLKELL